MNRASPLFYLLTAGVTVSSSAQTVPAAARVTRVADSLARAFIAAGHAPSVAIGLVRGADTIVMNAWGAADMEQDVAATARSVYRIGSVTKQFTASAVLQLVEQKKLALDDSIATFLPALPVAWHKVTIRQLLNHTSGIPSYTDIGPSWARRWGEEMTPDTLIALTARDPMWFAPGTSWRYDNTGYVVLGMLIERVTGRSWATDMSERFFKPLGLTNTYDCQAEPIVPHRVRGYEWDNGHWINTPYLAMSQPYAAGALCSTIGDLVRWNHALHTGHVLSSTSYTTMTTPDGVAARGALPYGFGMGTATVEGRPVLTHGGGIHGFTSGNAWVPGSQLSVTVLANAGSAKVDDLVKQLIRASIGVPLLAAPKALPLTAADRQKYIGVYALALPGGDRDLTIAARGDVLTAQLAGQGANPIINYGDHTFGASFDPALRFIFTIVGDKATKVVLLQGGGRFEGIRK